MNLRRMLATLVVAGASLVPATSADAGPTGASSLPMALLVFNGTGNQEPPRLTQSALVPNGWSCAQRWNPLERQLDTTCVPPAALPGTSNLCGWIASVSTLASGLPSEATPSVTTSCAGRVATAGGPNANSVSLTPVNAQLTSLRCSINLALVPPNVSFTAGCTTNH